MAGSRSSINEILPGRLYQRAQILTWQREVKYAFLQEHRISLVVNFWPKLDHDLCDAPGLGGYFYLPAPRSTQMLERRILLAARHTASLLAAREARALVLCEAGVTRSVFFCVLVVAALKSFPLPEAFALVRENLPRIRLKDFMMEYIQKDGAI